jgi:hypothetical protein
VNAARFCAAAAFAWCFLIAIGYTIAWLGNTDAWLLPPFGIGFALFAGLGLFGTFKAAVLTWISACVLAILIFSPGLAGVVLIVAAPLMFLAAILQSTFERRYKIERRMRQLEREARA